MAEPRADQLTKCNECVALAPLLYVAWADGELDPSEVEAVRGAAATHLLTDKQREAVDVWLDPAQPPTSTELLRLYRFVESDLSRLDAAARGSLVDLGLSLARLHGHPSEANRLALTEIEQALGLVGSEVVRALFEPRPPVDQSLREDAATFDVVALTRILDGEHRGDWERVRNLLREPLFLEAIPTDHDAHREQVLTRVVRIAEAGLGAVGFPREDGGAARMDRFVKIFEALGMCDLSVVVKFGVQFGLFGGAILNLGTERHHRALLGPAGRAEHLGGYAMTELGHGSNVRDIETIARYDAAKESFVLHSPSPSARKEWIGNAAVHGRTMVVFAQLEVGDERHGVHAFVVPVRNDDGDVLAGVTISDCGPKMGLNGVDNGRIAFDHVEVPRNMLLDRYGTVTAKGAYESPIASAGRRFFTMLGTLVGGRIGVASSSITATKKALAIAIRYGAVRRQFGPAGRAERRILDYRTHAERLFPRLAATYAFHFAVSQLQKDWFAADEELMREVETKAAAIKALATWHAIDTAQQCRECCGGMGFLSANQIAEIRKDVDVFATFEGDNTVLLQLVAKGLLSGYARAMSKDLVGTVLREIRRRAAAELLEKNPFAIRRTDDAHLREPAFHREALSFRTQSLIRSAARRVKNRTDGGMDGFDAVMDVQSHLIQLAEAYAEELVHAAFVEAVQQLVDGPEREALQQLLSLYGLWRLHADMAWFLENGYVETNKARAVRKLFVAQCERVRPHAVHLVNAFGIPEEVLRAPIAFDGYAARLA
ncbi:MAG: acyl-CoA dehydrogenase [Myxococcota bacterium]